MRPGNLMSDHKLKNGSEVTFDLDAFSIGEYEQFRRGTLPDSGDFEFMAKVTGIPAVELKALKFNEWRGLLRAFFHKSVSPLDDPN